MTDILEKFAGKLAGMTSGTWRYDGMHYVWSGDTKEPCRAMVCETRGAGTGEPIDKNGFGIVLIRNSIDEFVAVAKAVSEYEFICTSPIYDSDGDGVWCTPVQLGCGDCPNCVAMAAREALNAKLRELMP